MLKYQCLCWHASTPCTLRGCSKAGRRAPILPVPPDSKCKKAIVQRFVFLHRLSVNLFCTTVLLIFPSCMMCPFDEAFLRGLRKCWKSECQKCLSTISEVFKSPEVVCCFLFLFILLLSPSVLLFSSTDKHDPMRSASKPRIYIDICPSSFLLHVSCLHSSRTERPKQWKEDGVK